MVDKSSFLSISNIQIALYRLEKSQYKLPQLSNMDEIVEAQHHLYCGSYSTTHELFTDNRQNMANHIAFPDNVYF